jgi:uncharacterized membrane protein
MVSMGVLHFVAARFFVAIVPSYLPNPSALVAISGVFEILGGLGLLWPPLRKFASWGLVALYICVFPANINMALHPGHYAPWILYGRLPFQAVLIYWAWWVG